MTFDYDPIPHATRPDLEWHVLGYGAGNGCLHSHIEKKVWYAGPGGPLVEVKCLDCRRHLREELSGGNIGWPTEDR